PSPAPAAPADGGCRAARVAPRDRARAPAGGGAGAAGRARVGAAPSRPARPRRPVRTRRAARARDRPDRARGIAVTTLTELRQRADRILAEVEKAIVGKRGALELVLLALLSDGHVLIEDYPGLAKTLIARSFAQATSLRFARIQFTPDLMPGDVTGSQIFDQRTTEFVFRPGPVFANLLLTDEINRAPPKTQASLLEAMQERQVTIENTTHALEPPFLVLATQNPIEYEGTYPLPEAQLDRFLVRISIGYPAREDEIEMLVRGLVRGVVEVVVKPVLDAPTLVELQRALEQVHV